MTGATLPEAFHALVEVAILASVVDPFDPMEKAFHQLGERFLADTEHVHRDWRLVQKYALSPALRAMSHVWAASGGGAQTVATKGAPEAVMDLCHLDDTKKAHIASVVDELAADGLRVLAVARGAFDRRHGPPPSTTSTSNSSGCWVWRTRCARRCPPPWRNVDQPASAWS